MKVIAQVCVATFTHLQYKEHTHCEVSPQLLPTQYPIAMKISYQGAYLGGTPRH